MSRDEKKTLVLALLALVAFISEPWHGIPGYFAFCSMVLLGFTPIFNLMEASDLKKVQFPILFFIAGCMAIGAVAGVVGANKWAVAAIMPYLEGLPPTVSVICSYVAGTVANFLLTPFAATVAFTPAFGELGVQMGVNPLPLFYAFQLGLDQYFFPYEGVMFLYLFTTGCVTLKHIMPALGLRTLLAGILLVAVWVPYWNFIGLM